MTEIILSGPRCGLEQETLQLSIVPSGIFREPKCYWINPARDVFRVDQQALVEFANAILENFLDKPTCRVGSVEVKD